MRGRGGRRDRRDREAGADVGGSDVGVRIEGVQRCDAFGVS